MGEVETIAKLNKTVWIPLDRWLDQKIQDLRQLHVVLDLYSEIYPQKRIVRVYMTASELFVV